MFPYRIIQQAAEEWFDPEGILPGEASTELFAQFLLAKLGEHGFAITEAT
jgi:hypothetical protein